MRAIARTAGLTDTAVRSTETGASMPSVANVEAFAIALEVSPVSWHTGFWSLDQQERRLVAASQAPSLGGPLDVREVATPDVWQCHRSATLSGLLPARRARPRSACPQLLKAAAAASGGALAPRGNSAPRGAPPTSSNTTTTASPTPTSSALESQPDGFPPLLSWAAHRDSGDDELACSVATQKYASMEPDNTCNWAG